MRIRIAQVRLTPRELAAVQRVMKSGQLRAGPIVEKFEASFARSTGARFAVAVSSGTAALHLACSALLNPGDEVIVPDFTFVANASMVLAVGAKPVFADVDPRTFTLDAAEVERRITPRTRAIIPVHLYGHPAEILKLTRLARRYDLGIIWDAAQAHGARFQDRDVGSFPDVVCYSFYPTKNMTTGEGGMLTTSHAALARELRLMRSHGEESRYRHVRLGFNFRLTEMAAALGLEQLRNLPTAIERRRRHAAVLAQGLEGIPGITIPGEYPPARHAYNSYTIRVNPELTGVTRDKIQERLARRGIQTSVHYPLPLHRQPISRGFGRDKDFPVSSLLAKTVLSLPVHPGLTSKDLKWIIRAVREAAGSSD